MNTSNLSIQIDSFRIEKTNKKHLYLFYKTYNKEGNSIILSMKSNSFMRYGDLFNSSTLYVLHGGRWFIIMFPYHFKSIVNKKKVEGLNKILSTLLDNSENDKKDIM